MPKSVFQRLCIGEAKSTIVMLQLADRSYLQPEGKIEDILIRVGKFIFSTDFLILDCEADEHAPVILGRPFLATYIVLLDFKSGELVLRVHDQQVKINVFTVPRQKDMTEKCKSRKLSIKHLRRIFPRQYLPGQKVLNFNSRLKLFLVKLKSRWSNPFDVTQVSPHGAITIKSLKNGHDFMVKGKRLKPYMGAHTERQPARANISVVREFYNHNAAGENTIVYARNCLVPVGAATINNLFGLSNNEERIYGLIEAFEDQEYDILKNQLCIRGTDCNGDRNPGTVNRRNLHPKVKLWNTFVKRNLMPTSHNSTVDKPRLFVIHAILTITKFNVLGHHT
ncbi:hypothetical protein GQ457_05G020700 [Hibiscus cannabinus]